MDADWQWLKDEFQKLRHLEPVDRDSRLEEIRRSRGEDAVRQLSELLKQEQTDDTIQGIIDEAAVQTLTTVSADPIGKRFGSYEITELIGEGGMGRVYKARRADEEYQRTVAIKLLTGANDALIERFRRERQILASLDHPNIARMLDGDSIDGTPYIVMEYVKGIPIDRYCNELRLSVSERLSLYLDVCDAVDHAHRNLVIHRDIKPSNILVTEEGGVKLLDFGIAKLLDGSNLGIDPLQTREGNRFFTPAHASPEQLRGESLNVASDVYSLGVLLYQLLSGRMPYELTGMRPDEAYRAIVETDPEQPSTVVGTGSTEDEDAHSIEYSHRTTVGRLRRALAGDLDNIVLMAMRKAPERRYSSVRQLADDIRHHLNDRPITARPESFGYQVGKFLRRNTASTAAVAGLVIAVTGLTAFYTNRLSQERDAAEAARALAERERASAEQVSTFLTDLFLSVDPSRSRGEELTAREVVDAGAEKIRTELQDQPEIRADLSESLSQVYSNLGIYEEALEMIDAAVTIRDELAGDAPDQQLVATLRNKGIVHLERGEFKEAESVLKRSVDMSQTLHGDNNSDTVLSKSIYGWLLFNSGRYDEAEPVLSSAVAGGQSLVPANWFDDPTLAQTEEERALLNNAMSPMGNLGALYIYQARYEEAAEIYETILTIRGALLGNDHPLVMIALANYGEVLRRQGSHAEAEVVLRDALALNRQLHGNNSRVAVSLSNLGLNQNSQGFHEEAESLHREALAIRQTELGDDHHLVGETFNNIALTYMARDRWEEAEPLMRACVQNYAESFEKDHPKAVLGLANLGQVLIELGKTNEARGVLKDAKDRGGRSLKPDHPTMVLVDQRLARTVTP